MPPENNDGCRTIRLLSFTWPRMNASHKNKTFATLLTAFFGCIGFHRFYLYGWQDIWGWIRLTTLPLSAVPLLMAPDLPWILTTSPLILSVFISTIETLVIGLTPDEKWDARFNLHSGKRSGSRWLLIITMIVAFSTGTTFFFFVLARTVDLLYTGGAFG